MLECWTLYVHLNDVTIKKEVYATREAVEERYMTLRSQWFEAISERKNRVGILDTTIQGKDVDGDDVKVRINAYKTYRKFSSSQLLELLEWEE